MTAKQSLIWANKKLKYLVRAGHYDTPTLDAEILLVFAIKKPKEFLYAHLEKKLTGKQWNQFKKLIARRAKHEPVAYIIGQKSFYGLDFFVNKNVMIPRPETELLVEEILKSKTRKGPVGTHGSLCWILNLKSAIVDVGTGSGCIAISLAYHLPRAKIFATEISPGALEVARKNARHHKVAITFLRGNLLQPFLENLKSKILNLKSLIITANLPYLTTRQWRHTQPEIKKYEPRLALDGGLDGLKYHYQLFEQVHKLVKSYNLQVTSLIEIDPSQTKHITKLIRAYFPTAQISIKQDLAKRNRLVIFKI